MFEPKYTISGLLLNRIKEITTLMAELNRAVVPTATLVLLERKAREVSAHASTSIEGNPLSLEQVKQLLKNRPSQLRDTEREVLNYNQALKQVHSFKKKAVVDLKLTLKLHHLVMDDLIAKSRWGKLRTEPVFVNDPRRGEPVYLPPDAKEVPALMKDLFDFVKNQQGQFDPLILAGLFHKQFVIIHPFMDGNGRTVRLLTTLLLASLGLNTFTLFSFENYYNQNVSQYFKNVGAFGNYYDIKNKIDFTEWLEYFAGGIMAELQRVRQELKKAVRAPAVLLLPSHHIILDYLKRHAYITDRDYSRFTERAKATRVLDFNKLMEAGLIERFGQGKNTYYCLKDNL